MKAMLKNNRGISMVVVIMAMVILLSVTGAGLLFSGRDLKISGNYRSGTQAFYATDTGVYVALSQLQLNQSLASAALSRDLDSDGNIDFRSGGRDDSGPQPLNYNGPRSESGYSIAQGTGYNSNGYFFHSYQINITGFGPMNAAREINAVGIYGPAAQ